MGEIAERVRGGAQDAGGAGEWRRARGMTLAAFAALIASGSALMIVAFARLGGAPSVVVAGGYVAAVTLPLCVVDLRERRLPNTLVVPGFVFSGSGVVWQALARGSPPWAALGWCLAAVVAFGVLAAFGGVGMGDVKLAGMLALALGACGLGPEPIGLAVGTAFVGAGIAALGVRSGEIAFGPFLLAGFWVAVGAG